MKHSPLIRQGGSWYLEFQSTLGSWVGSSALVLVTEVRQVLAGDCGGHGRMLVALLGSSKRMMIASFLLVRTKNCLQALPGVPGVGER